MFGFGGNPFLSASVSVSDLFGRASFLRRYRLDHPDELPETGTIVFCGPQGSGKTLSAVNYVFRLSSAYPKAIICTNIDLIGLSDDVCVVPWLGLQSLTDLHNDEYGVIYLIDEMHLIYNSLDSKQVPPELMSTISQQRKQRKLIVGTSQLFLRLAKPIREQINRVVFCQQILSGSLQYNCCYDGQSICEFDGGIDGDIMSRHLWSVNPDMYRRYNTYALIERSASDWRRTGGMSLPYDFSGSLFGSTGLRR